MDGSRKIRMEDRRDEGRVTFVITEISWERVYLVIEAEIQPAAEGLEFFLVTEQGSVKAKMEAEEISGGKLRLRVNVTNPGYCSCLPSAVYSLYACDGNEIIAKAAVSSRIAEKVKDLGKVLIHDKGWAAFCIDFSIENNDAALFLNMRVMDTVRKAYKGFDNEKKPSRLAKIKNTGKRAAGWVLRTGHKAAQKCFQTCYSRKAKAHLSAENGKKTVLFLTQQNETIRYNLEAVRSRMEERGLDQDFETRLYARSLASVPKRKWPSYEFEVVKELACADYVFMDDHSPVLDWLVPDKRLVITQLWHAGAGYKAVGYSRWGHTSTPGPVSCHRRYTYGITPGREIAFFFSEQFGINEEQILPTGMPRMDKYLDKAHMEETKRKLYEENPAWKGKKVILFAPTYRGFGRRTAHYPFEKIDFQRLYDFCGSGSVVLFKMHPWVMDPVPIPENMKDRMFDVTRHLDINDFYYITDILISDYSSGMSEYALTGKPVLLYAFDELQFAYSRGFHREYSRNVPGKIVHTFDELMEALEKEDFDTWKSAAYARKHFDYTDTSSSDRVIDWILLGKMPEDIRERIAAKEAEVERLRRLDFSAVSRGK
ncbi:MAG: CDP-glycerol glycerophosphotransferase family protein [Lachnospiraceae bacterium]|nr:CDP-glycerol glycerophosphotransferase family protein [Lachnospiraceae bacterium]